MSLERASEYLRRFNLQDNIIIREESTATVEEAAQALHTEPARIAKTLSFMTEKPIVIVMAGDVKIDNHKYKSTFGKKAKMLTAEEVTSLIGHDVGGVCPFGINDGVDIYLDESLKRFETVFPAVGNAHSAIELTPEELDRITENNGWVDIGKLM